MSAPEAAWDRLLGVTEKTAEALARISLVLQQQAVDAREQAISAREHREMTLKLTATLERFGDVIERIEADQKTGRDKAVDDIKGHIDETLKKRGPGLIESLIAWAAILGSAALAVIAAVRGAKHEP